MTPALEKPITIEEQPSPLDAAIEQTTLADRKAELEFRETKFQFDQRRAKMFALSGLFKATKDQTLDEAIAQAMVRIEMGESMGFGAAESMAGIDIISNRPAVQSSLRASRMQLAGYSWDIQWHWEAAIKASPCTGCTLWLKYRGKPMMQAERDGNGVPLKGSDGPMMYQASVSFTRHNAESMFTTIWENNQKKRVSLLQKWEHAGSADLQDMYFSRCVTRAQKRYAPAVLSASILSVEEAMDEPGDITGVTEPAAAPKSTGGGNAGLRDKLRAGAEATERGLSRVSTEDMETIRNG